MKSDWLKCELDSLNSVRESVVSQKTSRFQLWFYFHRYVFGFVRLIIGIRPAKYCCASLRHVKKNKTFSILIILFGLFIFIVGLNKSYVQALKISVFVNYGILVSS